MKGEAVLVRKVRIITILGVLMALVMSCLGCSGNLPAAKQESPIKISTEEIKDNKDNLELMSLPNRRVFLKLNLMVKFFSTLIIDFT